ncbi:hypothetical protein GBAR_LOCUS15352 [Geodia barretti]|uniref:Uncharacterized protein n=1 Tax=Geodia barretti TaxID=519541 RepID=A0AA35SB18_GEOBA|nr:hypothetical protein GBAR_LOCUS15352 [Geodia barretti]
MDDNELRSFVSQVREEFPTIGESLVIAPIHCAGYHVSRSRILSAIRITDPINTALRWRGITASRRPYSVAGPNSLWHIGILLSLINPRRACAARVTVLGSVRVSVCYSTSHLSKVCSSQKRYHLPNERRSFQGVLESS